MIKNKKQLYITLYLFFTVFKITMLTLGGGLIIISELKKFVVKKREIISEDDFNKIISISNIIPGVTAINAVFLIGKKFGGLLCAFLLTIAGILPSIIVIIIISIYINQTSSNIYLQKFLEGAKISSIIIMASVILEFSKNMIKGSISKLIICFLIVFIIHNLKIDLLYILLTFFAIYSSKYIIIKKINDK